MLGAREVRDERGVTIVLVALSLAVLMIFAAFAVDIGAVYSERRQSQSAADAGALAAARRIANGEGRAVAVQEALDISQNDVDFPQSSADWAADFLNDCPETPPAGYSATAATPCVSFSFNNQRVRVHLPDMEVRTRFAGVLGINWLHTSAYAEAGLRIVSSSDVLPYGLPSESANGNEVCIKVPSTLNHADLDADTQTAYLYSGCSGDASDPDTGNFRRLDAAIYGNFDTGTAPLANVPYCPPGGSGLNADDVIALNTAFGVDHLLTAHPDPSNDAPSLPSDIDDWGRCPDFGAGPNTIHTQTGTTSSGLTRGMSAPNVVSSARPGRLVGATTFTTEIVRSANPAWEVAPLWEFIDPSETDLPAVCRRATFDDSASDAALAALGVPAPPWRSATLTKAAPYPLSPATQAERGNESRAHMFHCLNAYRAGSGYATLFGLDSDGDPDNRRFDIQATNRFGFVPVLDGEASSNVFRIGAFAPVYLDTAYFQCNASGCNYRHSPGDSSLETSASLPVPSNRTMDSMSAYFLVGTGILPPEIIEDAPGLRSNLQLELVK